MLKGSLKIFLRLKILFSQKKSGVLFTLNVYSYLKDQAKNPTIVIEYITLYIRIYFKTLP